MPNCPPNGTGCGNGGDVSVCDAMTMVMTVAMVINNDDDSSDCGQGYKS